jgi:hypothetical protein
MQLDVKKMEMVVVVVLPVETEVDNTYIKHCLVDELASEEE